MLAKILNGGNGRSAVVVSGLLLAFAAGLIVTGTESPRRIAADTWRAIGGSSSAEAQAGTRDWQPTNLASFDEFPAYWLGSEFEGMKLTRIIRHISPAAVPAPENLVLLIYGSCEIQQNATGCRPPVSVRIERACAEPRSGFAAQSFDQAHVAVRGLDAARVSGHLRLWTGGAAVTIYAAGPDAEAVSLRAAEALQPANARAQSEKGLAPTGQLPQPIESC